MVDPSKELELMILFFRFDQRDSNSSLKFGQLTATWLKSWVSNLQMKQRAPSIFESHGTLPLRPNRLPHESNLLLQMLY